MARMLQLLRVLVQALPRWLLRLLGALAWAVRIRCLEGSAGCVVNARTPEFHGKSRYFFQMRFARTFDHERLERVFRELVSESVIPQSAARVEFLPGEPLAGPTLIRERKDHKAQYPGLAILLSVFESDSGETTFQGNLPLDTYDGTSNFNIMKELVHRYCGGEKNQVFRTLALAPGIEHKLSSSFAFLQHVLAVLKTSFANVWYECHYDLARSSGAAHRTDSCAFLTFTEAETATVLARAAEEEMKPFAFFLHAVLASYSSLESSAKSGCPRHMPVLQAVSMQQSAFAPRLPKSLVGDWLNMRCSTVDPAAFTRRDARRLHQELSDEVSSFGPDLVKGIVNRAYSTESSGWFAQFASISSQRHITPYNFWMNNYGQRTVHPDAKLLSWHWPAAFGAVALNSITVDGKLCITLASRFLSSQDLDRLAGDLRSRLQGKAALPCGLGRRKPAGPLPLPALALATAPTPARARAAPTLRPLEASGGCGAFVPAFSGALGQLSSREAGQAAVERLFRRLLAEPELAEALNATCPEVAAAKLIYKAEGREHLGHAQDRKCTIDLNKRKLEASRGFFAERLGDDGLLALRFCDELMGSVAPAALQGLAGREDFGRGLLRFHESRDFAVRFLFYPEHEAAAGSQGIRCGEHVDSSTCTLILQDSTGGLQVKPRSEGEWRDVSEPLLLMVGCAGDILTNHRVQALLHRVVDAPPVAAKGRTVIPQRLSTVVFLDCDPEKRLEPLLMAPGEPPHFKAGLTKSELKAAITNFNFCREHTASATAAAPLSSPEEGSTAILRGLVR